MPHEEDLSLVTFHVYISSVPPGTRLLPDPGPVAAHHDQGHRVQEPINQLSHTGRCVCTPRPRVTAAVPVRNSYCEAIPRGFGAGGSAGSALLQLYSRFTFIR